MKATRFAPAPFASIVLAGTAELSEAAPRVRVPDGVEVIHDVQIGKGGDKTLHAKIARPGDPPFLIVHGDKDATVPHEQSEKLAAVLKRAGGSVELITVKGGGRGMAAPAREPPAEPDRNALNAAVVAFFNKHLKPSIAEYHS